ncbi:AMP-binding enzyme [Sphingomonas asaccharolytica]|uniref:AMP-binding enzyme n=1 Tax=Sphingomonas asaccharolytica TaxID=40681 RepID=UPI00082DD5A8|nr:hypothetical protein [Sphingomonas asaccharolytica]
MVGEIFFAAETATRFHYIGADPRLDREGCMSLGYLGYLDEDGYLFLSDRRTDMILRGGVNIYPAEVEAVLVEHPAIADAVVLGLPSEDYGVRVHAIVHLANGLSPKEIDAFVRARLVSQKCPESYEMSMPRYATKRARCVARPCATSVLPGSPKARASQSRCREAPDTAA